MDCERLGKSSHWDKELVGDMLKIIQYKHDTFLHSIQQRPFNILKLPKFLLTHKITQQRIQLNSSINPNLNKLTIIVSW